jgi:hypothetical protein
MQTISKERYICSVISSYIVKSNTGPSIASRQELARKYSRILDMQYQAQESRAHGLKDRKRVGVPDFSRDHRSFVYM